MAKDLGIQSWGHRQKIKRAIEDLKSHKFAKTKMRAKREVSVTNNVEQEAENSQINSVLDNSTNNNILVETLQAEANNLEYNENAHADIEEEAESDISVTTADVEEEAESYAAETTAANGCEICGTSFTRKDNLALHLKNKLK